MRTADLIRLLVLAALWGGSYLFMRIAVPHAGPEWVAEGRTLAGALVMTIYLAATRTPPAIAKYWRGYLVIGLGGVAIPAWLIGTALQTIDASTAAILNATTPIFVAILASIWIGERLTVEKISGIVLSMAGIAILVGWTPRPTTRAEWVACLLTLAASASYASVGVFTKARMSEAPPASLSAASCLVAAMAMAPFTPWTVDAGAVPVAAWLSIAALGILCTGIALILYYRLIADVGPVRTVMVSLLVPVFGMLWGVVFLDEPVTPGRIAGCAIVLMGCALALGLLRLPFRPAGK